MGKTKCKIFYFELFIALQHYMSAVFPHSPFITIIKNYKNNVLSCHATRWSHELQQRSAPVTLSLI